VRGRNEFGKLLIRDTARPITVHTPYYSVELSLRCVVVLFAQEYGQRIRVHIIIAELVNSIKGCPGAEVISGL